MITFDETPTYYKHDLGTIPKTGRSVTIPQSECSSPLRWCTLYGNLRQLYQIGHSASGSNVSMTFETYTGSLATSSASVIKIVFNSTSINSNNTITFNVLFYIDNTPSQGSGTCYYHSIKQ